MPPDLNSSYIIKQMAFNSTGDLYIVNLLKVYFTTNGGNTWEVLVNGDSVGWSLTRIQIDIQGNIYTSDDTFDPYHGYYEDIYKSTDNGSSWQLDVSSYGYGIQFDNFETLPSGEMYAGILFGNFYFKKSPGLPWTNIQASIDPGSIIVNRFYDVYVSKYYSTGNIMPSRCSPDYGTTWFDIDDGTLRFHNLEIDKNGYLYAATSTGLFKSIESTFPIVRNLSLNFPQTAIGDTTTLGVYFSDPFNIQLIIDSIKINSQVFHCNATTPFIVNPGDSQLVSIIFTPTNYGNYEDTLKIYSNLKTQNVPLSGDSPAPQVVTNPISFHYWHFPNTPVDSTNIKTIQIINSFVNFLKIDSIYTNSSQFRVNSFTYPIYLVSDSITLDISFIPDTNIIYYDTVFISNNSTTPLYIISVNGKGVFLANVNIQNGEITAYELFDNYPNPFNPTTKIKYQLPELSKVKLTVYDVLGREVKILVNEEKPAGNYEVEFDGTNLPSGIYFYRIETSKFSDTKKFVLLK
jgi:hypothetical protein